MFKTQLGPVEDSANVVSLSLLPFTTSLAQVVGGVSGTVLAEALVLAAERGEDPWDTLFRLLVDTEGRVGALYHMMSEEDVVVLDWATFHGVTKDDIMKHLEQRKAAPAAPAAPPSGEPVPLRGDAIAAVVTGGWDLLLLGMGADAHVGALYPGSPALDERQRLCAAVDRPDGMTGLTLTPPAMLAAKKILLLVTGAAKAITVRRTLDGADQTRSRPVTILAGHPDVTFVLDDAAAAKA